MAKKRAHSDHGLRLELTGQVTLARLGEALEAWTTLLREVGREVTGVGGRDAIRYVITEAKGGSFSLAVAPQAAKKEVRAAVVPRIAATVTSGLRALERSPKRPKHFNDAALESLRNLAHLTGPETPSVKVSNGSGSAVALSNRMVEHVDAVLEPEFESIGTVEGQLEGLIIHGKRRFLVYDPLTGRQVTCYFTSRVQWEAVLKAFGKRVAVTGAIRSRSSGDRVSIVASRLFVFPAEDDLPAPETIRESARSAH